LMWGRTASAASVVNRCPIAWRRLRCAVPSMPSMGPGGWPPGSSAPVRGVSHRLAIRHARDVLTLSRSGYRWTTHMGSPPAGAITREWPSVSTGGNRPPGVAANVSGIAGAGRARVSGVVMGSLLRMAPRRPPLAGTEAPARCPSALGAPRVLGQHARLLIPGDPHCSYLDARLAPQVTGHLGRRGWAKIRGAVRASLGQHTPHGRPLATGNKGADG